MIRSVLITVLFLLSALSSGCSPTLVSQTPQVAPTSIAVATPEETPSDDNFIEVPTGLPELEAATEKAQSTWPEFEKAFADKSGQDYTAKFRFTEADEKEFMWIEVTKIEAGQVHGTLSNEPVILGGFQFGDKVSFPVDDVQDWVYYVGEERVGGYSIDVLNNL